MWYITSADLHTCNLQEHRKPFDKFSVILCIPVTYSLMHVKVQELIGVACGHKLTYITNFEWWRIAIYLPDDKPILGTKVSRLTSISSLLFIYNIVYVYVYVYVVCVFTIADHLKFIEVVTVNMTSWLDRCIREGVGCMLCVIREGVYSTHVDGYCLPQMCSCNAYVYSLVICCWC